MKKKHLLTDYFNCYNLKIPNLPVLRWKNYKSQKLTDCQIFNVLKFLCIQISVFIKFENVKKKNLHSRSGKHFARIILVQLLQNIVTYLWWHMSLRNIVCLQISKLNVSKKNGYVDFKLTNISGKYYRIIGKMWFFTCYLLWLYHIIICVIWKNKNMGFFYY